MTQFTDAARADLPDVIRLLADDRLGATREQVADPLPAVYIAAFDAIAADPSNTLIVARSGARIVGVLQLTFIPSLTYQGSWRAQIEGVRVAASERGQGLGGDLIRHAVARAAAKGCRIVQLTTDKQRPEALRFYESLGFVASHEGMKLHLR